MLNRLFLLALVFCKIINADSSNFTKKEFSDEFIKCHKDNYSYSLTDHFNREPHNIPISDVESVITQLAEEEYSKSAAADKMINKLKMLKTIPCMQQATAVKFLKDLEISEFSDRQTLIDGIVRLEAISEKILEKIKSDPDSQVYMLIKHTIEDQSAFLESLRLYVASANKTSTIYFYSKLDSLNFPDGKYSEIIRITDLVLAANKKLCEKEK